jgi:hypothetical protein
MSEIFATRCKLLEGGLQWCSCLGGMEASSTKMLI